MSDQFLFLDSLLSEPSYELTMDCEGFQDLKLWCDLTTMDGQLNTPSIDKERRFAIDQTLDTNTPFDNDTSPSGVWDTFNIGDDVCISPGDLLSSVPCIPDDYLKEDSFVTNQFNVNAMDIENMPIVFKDLPGYEESVDISSNGKFFIGAKGLGESSLNDEGHVIIKEEEWDMPIGREESVEDTSNDNVQTSIYSTFSHLSTYNTVAHFPYDSQEAKLTTTNLSNFQKCQLPNANTDVMNEVIDVQKVVESQQYYAKPLPKKNIKNLNLNIVNSNLARYNASGFNKLDPIITTPDVLLTVEQLEAERKFNLMQYVDQVPPHPEESLHVDDSIYGSRLTDDGNADIKCDIKMDNENCEDLPISITPPATPDFKSTKRSHKRRRTSEDSDESYVPPTVKRQHKTQRVRKSSTSTVIVSKSVLELDIPKRKGRPPKRRESLASTCTNTTDDNVSILSTEEHRYRELRDKNNEASRRSRMNRKVKENENEKLAVELEKRNRMLTVKAERLEKTAKLLKDALMAAMLKR